MLYANIHTQSFSNENWALLYNCPMTCFFYLIPSLGGSGGKASACNAGDLGSVSGLGRSLGERNSKPLQYSLEKEMAAHSSILAWRIPGTEEPGGLLSMGSHRVGHN